MPEPTLVYEDDSILAINKPAGMVVLKLQNYYPGLILAHRLDRDTSGVMLLAKDEATHEYLKTQFKMRQIKKIYQALVYGELKESEGVIDLPIGRSRKDPRKRLAGRGAVSTLRPSVTHWRVLERLKDFTFLELRPATGRTHQLRVHLKAIGHPVVCDHLYAPSRPCSPPLARQALHALSLEFTSPAGARLNLVTELAPDIAAALDRLREL